MKSIKSIVGFPFIASGLIVLSAGTLVFCFGCWLAEKSQNIGGKK